MENLNIKFIQEHSECEDAHSLIESTLSGILCNNMSVLEEVTFSKSLDLSSTQVVEIEPLRNLWNAETLHVEGNRITNSLSLLDIPQMLHTDFNCTEE